MTKRHQKQMAEVNAAIYAAYQGPNEGRDERHAVASKLAQQFLNDLKSSGYTEDRTSFRARQTKYGWPLQKGSGASYDNVSYSGITSEFTSSAAEAAKITSARKQHEFNMRHDR